MEFRNEIEILHYLGKQPHGTACYYSDKKLMVIING